MFACDCFYSMSVLFSEVHEMCFNYHDVHCFFLFVVVSLEVFFHSNVVEDCPVTQSRFRSERRRLRLKTTQTQKTAPFCVPLGNSNILAPALSRLRCPFARCAIPDTVVFDSMGEAGDWFFTSHKESCVKRKLTRCGTWLGWSQAHVVQADSIQTTFHTHTTMRNLQMGYVLYVTLRNPRGTSEGKPGE